MPNQGIALGFHYNTLGRLNNTFITPPSQDSLTFLGINYDTSTIPPEHDSSQPRSYPLNSCFQFGGFYLKITSKDGMPILEMQSIESSLQNKASEITQLNVRKRITPSR